MQNDLLKDIRYLKGVGEKRAQLFNKLGIFTMQDLIYHLPRKYIDYSNPYDIAFAPYDEYCVVKATVLEIGGEVRISGGRSMCKVICADDTAKLSITYFNAMYTVKQLQVGEEYYFYGKFNGSMLIRQSAAPSFILATDIVTQQPVYALTAGISNKIITNTIKQTLESINEIEDYMPKEILGKYNLTNLDKAIRDIHFAKSLEDLSKAKERLIFDEFLFLQLGMKLLDKSVDRRTLAVIKSIDISNFLNNIPFTPTDAQLNAINDILKGFTTGISMNRLVQGDVGSGKTLVGFAAIYAMANNNFQSCMMAPTEILANQHYYSAQKMLGNLGINIALLTASTKAKQRKEILSKLQNGDIDVLIGTHSVLNESVVFKNLGLSITDEQHRFGVNQRNLIGKKGENPHIIVMSATPIPRTLAMIIYGNMQISVINQMPKGRKQIKTLLVGTDKRERMYGFIDEHIKNGYQAYVVLPAIEENDTIDIQNVLSYHQEVIKLLLPNAKSEILHGKMKAKEKDEVMQRFAKGETDIICTTTVIEVGVDVPNAVLMVIENAERYGLSALHQLRGRVGRGDVQSYCMLVSDSKSKLAQERLRFLVNNSDGFMVSQFDLDLRGPGDFFGNRQHGLPEFKIAQLSNDLTTLDNATKAADYFLNKTNSLDNYPKIKYQTDIMLKKLVL